jgi:hypothetical protein
MEARFGGSGGLKLEAATAGAGAVLTGGQRVSTVVAAAGVGWC